MKQINYISLALFYLGTVSYAAENTCKSFGVDFQDAHTYFQNSQSQDPFTFAQTFEGCQADVAQNLVINPRGDQLQCSDTPMTPPNTPELSTCPIKKSEIAPGDWSIVVISNNGNGQPIAYQRDFILSVGPQSTMTVTPTVIVNVTSTPIVNITSTTLETNYTTLPAITVTAPSMTITPTRIVTPPMATQTNTHFLWTIRRIVPTVTATKIVKTVTPACTWQRQVTPDKKAMVKPTVNGIHAAALESGAPAPAPTPAPAPPAPPAGAPPVGAPPAAVTQPAVIPKQNVKPATPVTTSRSFRWNWGGRWIRRDDLNDTAAFLANRREYLSKHGQVFKRAPDQPVITKTIEDEKLWKTTTSTVFAPTQYVTEWKTNYAVQTVTPSPITIIDGKTTAVEVVRTLPAYTKTVQKYTVTTEQRTVLYTYTQVIYSTVTPGPSAPACWHRGGWYGGW